MGNISRRNFLKKSGIVAGVLTTSSLAYPPTRRWLIRTADGTLDDSDDLSKRCDLEHVGVSVYEGSSGGGLPTGDVVPDVKLKHPNETSPSESPDIETSLEDPHEYQWDNEALDLPAVHERSEGQNARVAVIDNGVLESHPLVSPSINSCLSKSFTDDERDHNPIGGATHGTEIAGIIAGSPAKSIRYVGTAPQTEIVDCRVFTGSFANLSDILSAIDYAISIDVDVINLSLNYFPSVSEYTPEQYRMLREAVRRARRKGTAVVTPAGNSGIDLSTVDRHQLPLATIPDTITTSATGPVGFKPSGSEPRLPFRTATQYTNYGTDIVDIAAPGGTRKPNDATTFDAILIPSFEFDGDMSMSGRDNDLSHQTPGFSWSTGTSYATAQISGIITLVRDLDPDISVVAVEEALYENASVPTDGERRFFGSGFVNPAETLAPVK